MQAKIRADMVKPKIAEGKAKPRKKTQALWGSDSLWRTGIFAAGSFSFEASGASLAQANALRMAAAHSTEWQAMRVCRATLLHLSEIGEAGDPAVCIPSS